MTPCGACSRLIRSGEGSCPFCEQRHRTGPMAVGLLGLVYRWDVGSNATTLPDDSTAEESAGCCAGICNLSALDPDLDRDNGQIGIAYDEDAQAYPGYEDVGVCTTPK